MQKHLHLAIGIAAAGLAVYGVKARRAAPAPPPLDVAAYRRADSAWRVRRLEAIAGRDGWATLVGLHWLHAGAQRAGGDASAAIALPADRAPRTLGTFVVDSGARGSTVRFIAAPAARVTVGDTVVDSLALRTDADGARPTVLTAGSLTLRVLARDGRVAVRVKDTAATARTRFARLDYFPLDTAWRVHGRLVRGDSGRTIRIMTILGYPEDMPSPGVVEFTVNGERHRIDALFESPGDTSLFLIFRDATSADATYPAGRYLYTSRPDADGNVVLDFNHAYNPPCAFSTFATCPLPPRQNQLPIRIEAGERRYRGAH